MQSLQVHSSRAADLGACLCDGCYGSFLQRSGGAAEPGYNARKRAHRQEGGCSSLGPCPEHASKA